MPRLKASRRSQELLSELKMVELTSSAARCKNRTASYFSGSMPCSEPHPLSNLAVQLESRGRTPAGLTAAGPTSPASASGLVGLQTATARLPSHAKARFTGGLALFVPHPAAPPDQLPPPAAAARAAALRWSPVPPPLALAAGSSSSLESYEIAGAW